MKLSAKRALFTKLLAELILWAHQNHMLVALDQVKRTQAEANSNAAKGAGISNSLHLVGLAADLILYQDDPTTPEVEHEYRADSASYKRLGDKWKSMHPLCRWGGDFTKPVDGNHFSLEHNGVK